MKMAKNKSDRNQVKRRVSTWAFTLWKNAGVFVKSVSPVLDRVQQSTCQIMSNKTDLIFNPTTCLPAATTITQARKHNKEKRCLLSVNQVHSHCFVPCIVHRCASIDVRCTGVCTVHHQQLSLQDLASLCCHMKRGGTFLLEGKADTQRGSGQESN